MALVQLLMDKEVVEEYHNIPNFLLQQVGAFAPLLQQSLKEPLPLLVKNQQELETTKKLMQWLRRDVSLGQLVTDMIEFRALANCADKYDVTQLLEEMSVYFCFS